MSPVVVGALFGGPELRGRQRLGAVRCLDLRLLIDRPYDGAAGRVEIQAHDVGDLLDAVPLVAWRPGLEG